MRCAASPAAPSRSCSKRRRWPSQIELAAMELLAAWGLALLDELNGAYDTVAERCRFILSRWEQIEDVHYAVPALRWAVSFFATTQR